MKKNVVDKYIDRIVELLENGNRGRDSIVDAEEVFAALNLVERFYGTNSFQYRILSGDFEGGLPDLYGTEPADIRTGILRNLRAELRDGLLDDIATQMIAEILGDTLRLAKEHLQLGFKDVAAVLASAVLEDSLKRRAVILELEVEDKTLPEVINALGSKGVLKNPEKKLLMTYVDLRNAAMHANWDKVQHAQVSSLIGYLEPQLLEFLS